MVKAELVYYDADEETPRVGCPNCEDHGVEWAENVNGTLWKQCGACGMIYVGHDDEPERESE
jgi:hypothetical protein